MIEFGGVVDTKFIGNARGYSGQRGQNSIAREQQADFVFNNDGYPIEAMGAGQFVESCPLACARSVW